MPPGAVMVAKGHTMSRTTQSVAIWKKREHAQLRKLRKMEREEDWAA